MPLECPHCHMTNPPGTLFCCACALPLGTPMALPLSAPIVSIVAVPLPLGRAVRLVELANLQPTGREVALPATTYTGTIYLGRNDLAGGTVVDVDFTPLGGYEKRVSRRQAKIHYEGLAGANGVVRLEEWESAHGNWLNKQRLAVGQREPLADGDEIRLADFVFRLAIG